MYQPLHSWKTPLYQVDCESCALAYCFPCHIYAMANKPHYATAFLMYAFAVLSIHRLWYELYYMKKHQCPSSKVDYCLGTDCIQKYTVVNGVTTPCVLNDICTYSMHSCLEKTPFTEVSIVLSLFYMALFMMHFFIRKMKREEKQIQGNDLLESTIPCGLAQLYREMV